MIKKQISQTWMAVGLLLVGAVAWIGVLVVVLKDDAAPQPEVEPAATTVIQQPSLDAARSTVLPTVLPTKLSTELPRATNTATTVIVPTATLVIPSATAVILTQGPIPTPTAGAVVTIVAAESTAPTTAGCVPPEGWVPYVVQPGDTLFAFQLGTDSAVTVDDILAANCLTDRFLLEGQMLFLPPGAAENAPSSDPYVAPSGETGPRTPNCPCTITITTGWRREQIADAISSAETMFTGADFLNVTGPGASAPFDFVMNRPAGTSMEGFLFPGSYTVENDTTAEAFRDMLLQAFAANVSGQMQADAAAQGVTFYQALIIASIVQRETRAPETQKLVASVYYNRYRAGNRLGATVTIQYAVGGPGDWWPRLSSSQLEVASPYNTYIQAGLPPAPIDSPGLSAISATVYAPQTSYYYHTAACDGSGEVFAETYEEHLQNVNCE